MATWKKIIVSGSDAVLNALTLDTPLVIGTGVNQFLVGVDTRTIQFAGGPTPGVVNLRFPDEPDNTYTIDLPAATGTVALLSDVANANLAVSGSTQNSTINLATQALTVQGARAAVTTAVAGNAVVSVNVRDASGTDDGLISTGSQTITGTKTFSNAIRHGSVDFLELTGTDVKYTGNANGGSVALRFDDLVASNFTISIPNATGTVALTSDLPTVGNGTLTLATSGIATGDQTFTANQSGNATFTVNVPATNLDITAGTTAGPIVTSSTGTDATLPTASGTASGVVTTGAQTWAGVKTFSSTIAGSISGTSANVTGTVAIGNGGTGATTAAGARTNLGATTVGANLFTLTNPGAIRFLRVNAGNTVDALDAAAFRTAIGAGTVTSVAALTIGTTGTNITSTVANSTTTPVITLNVPDASATARGVITTGAQTIAGAKTFQNDVVIAGSAGGRSLRIQAVAAGNAIVDLVPATGGEGILNVSGSFPLVLQTNSIPRLTIADNGNATFAQNVIISGDLTVDGSTTTLNTTNLLVEDRYILLNSGSAGGVNKGGIIVDGGSGIGKAFILGQTSGRWGFTGSLAQDATTATPDAFAAAVVTSEIAEYEKVGNIRVDTGTGDIFIYS